MGTRKRKISMSNVTILTRHADLVMDKYVSLVEKGKSHLAAKHEIFAIIRGEDQPLPQTQSNRKD